VVVVERLGLLICQIECERVRMMRMCQYSFDNSYSRMLVNRFIIEHEIRYSPLKISTMDPDLINSMLKRLDVNNRPYIRPMNSNLPKTLVPPC
jgi:hypothetical protein